MRRILAAAMAFVLAGTCARVASSSPEEPQRPGPASSTCADYIVIDSRGSGERGGLSAPGAVFYPTFRAAVLRRDRAAKVAVIPNGYPAWGSIPTLISALANLPQRYHQSVVEGKDWLSGRLDRLLTTCPQSRFVLTGYSQGAHVAGDVYQNISSRRIIGVVLFGDPKFNSADPAARGGKSGLDGALGTRPLFRSQPGKHSTGHALSYCHDRDPVCQGVSRLRYGSTHHRYDGTGEPQQAAEHIARFATTVSQAPPTVRVEPRAPNQSARLGKLIVSEDGKAKYHSISLMGKQFSGAECRLADRVVHPPNDPFEHIMFRTRDSGLTAYLGSITALDCAGGPYNALVAAEWLRITSNAYPVLTPIGSLRVGEVVPAPLDRIATKRGANLYWPIATACDPNALYPLTAPPRTREITNYLMHARTTRGRVAGIDLRSGVLEVGECGPSG